jgi:hypothetical protein
MRYAKRPTTKQMTRTIIAIGLLILAGLTIMFYMVGSHGRLMFRPHMTEDWVIWGIAVLSATSGLYLLTKKQNRKI